MTPYETTRYRCDHCRKSYARKGACAGHEAKCHHDPAVRACTTCVHFERADSGYPNICHVAVFEDELRDPVTGGYDPMAFVRHCSKWELRL